MNPRRNKEEFANTKQNGYSEGDRHCASAAPRGERFGRVERIGFS
jgi:hypothetical protein